MKTQSQKRIGFFIMPFPYRDFKIHFLPMGSNFPYGELGGCGELWGNREILKGGRENMGVPPTSSLPPPTLPSPYPYRLFSPLLFLLYVITNRYLHTVLTEERNIYKREK